MKNFLLILVSIAIIFFLAQRIQEDWQRHQSLTEEVSGLELRKENLIKEQERLEQLLEQGSQEEILEKEVRSMLGFKKEGEEVVLIIPPTDNVESSTNSASGLSASLNSQNSFLSSLSRFWYNLLDKLNINK